MSNKFLKNTDMYIASKKQIYAKFIIIFILLILATSIFLFYTKSFILESLKDSLPPSTPTRTHSNDSSANFIGGTT